MNERKWEERKKLKGHTFGSGDHKSEKKDIYNDGEIGYDGEEKNIKRRWLKKKEAESLQVSLGV
jgi:hypothetical protein